MLYRDAQRGRIVQNIGGIANLTAIPPGTGAGSGVGPEHVVAFDTGPGNMVIDGVMTKLFNKLYDDGGRIAAKGKPIDSILKKIMRGAFFRSKPPKTAGREEFGREFVDQFLRSCGKAKKEDIVATATALTAQSIAAAIRDFLPGAFGEGQDLSRHDHFRRWQPQLYSGEDARRSITQTDDENHS